MKLRPPAEMAPIIRRIADHLQDETDSMILATLCGAAQALRDRGVPVGVLVRSLIETAEELAAESVFCPRGQG